MVGEKEAADTNVTIALTVRLFIYLGIITPANNDGSDRHNLRKHRRLHRHRTQTNPLNRPAAFHLQLSLDQLQKGLTIPRQKDNVLFRHSRRSRPYRADHRLAILRQKNLHGEYKPL